MANADRIINVTNNLANITNVVNNLPNYVNTSDATANNTDILNGQTAYVNGQKITGIMNNYGDVNIDPTTSSQIYNGGYYNSININAVTASIDSNITANNIANGINILGIIGTFEGGTNTMDATATANDIALGLTAYANNTKITGTVNVLDGNNLWIMNSSNDPIINGTNIEFSYLWNQGRRISDNGFRLNTSVPTSNLASTLNITASNLAVGFNTLGIEGNYTADANAVASGIYNGQTAYVNGVKLSGTCTWTDALAGGTITELEALADNILGVSPVDPYAKYNNISDTFLKSATILYDLAKWDMYDGSTKLLYSNEVNISIEPAWNFSSALTNNEINTFINVGSFYFLTNDASYLVDSELTISDNGYTEIVGLCDGYGSTIYKHNIIINSVSDIQSSSWYYTDWGEMGEENYLVDQFDYNIRVDALKDYLNNANDWMLVIPEYNNIQISDLQVICETFNIITTIK